MGVGVYSHHVMNKKTSPTGTKHEGVILVRGKGTGFVALPDFDEDILIPPEALSFALDCDVVEI